MKSNLFSLHKHTYMHSNIHTTVCKPLDYLSLHGNTGRFLHIVMNTYSGPSLSCHTLQQLYSLVWPYVI